MIGTIKSLASDLIDLLKEIELINDAMQKKVEPGSTDWQNHESIDGYIVDALLKLGE